VKGAKKIGVRLGNWLTAEPSLKLWQAPDGERLKENATAHFWPSYLPVVYGDTNRYRFAWSARG
jgi:hypothetical protein